MKTKFLTRINSRRLACLRLAFPLVALCLPHLIGFRLVAEEEQPFLRGVLIPKLEIKGETAKDAIQAWVFSVDEVGSYSYEGNELTSRRFQVNLNMENVDAIKALKEICRQAGLTYSLSEEGLGVKVEIHDWTNTAGKVVKARFCGLEGDAVVLGLETGQKVNVPLNNLSEDNRNLAARLWEKLKP